MLFRTALADCNTRYPAGNPKTAVARAICINKATGILLPIAPYPDRLRAEMANRLSVARAFASGQITGQQANTLIEQKATRALSEINTQQSQQIQSRSVIVQPPSPAIAESSTRNIENAVAACVAVVHSLGSQHFGSQYFDAYYNPADHKVYNNIQYVYEQQYLFLFNKCMVSHGFPLTY
jgi:hypothetical protein